jgi:hypothetical protein
VLDQSGRSTALLSERGDLGADATPAGGDYPGGRSFRSKDSYAVLNLTPLGYEPLFDATWIWRDPQPVPLSDIATWRILRDAAALAR